MNSADRHRLIQHAIRSAIRAYERGDMQRVGEALAFAREKLDAEHAEAAARDESYDSACASGEIVDERRAGA
jgi:hypothetical protein